MAAKFKIKEKYADSEARVTLEAGQMYFAKEGVKYNGKTIPLGIPKTSTETVYVNVPKDLVEPINEDAKDFLKSQSLFGKFLNQAEDSGLVDKFGNMIAGSSPEAQKITKGTVEKKSNTVYWVVGSVVVIGLGILTYVVIKKMNK